MLLVVIPNDQKSESQYPRNTGVIFEVRREACKAFEDQKLTAKLGRRDEK